MINSIQANTASALQASNAQPRKEEKDSILARKSKDAQEVSQEVAKQNRIAQIKEDIENKDYTIDLRKTSEKMALDLLNL